MNVHSVEGWYVIFQTLSVIFIMLTVGTGAGTIITGYVASIRQAAKVAGVEHDNLVLQGDLNTEKGKVAGLQKQRPTQ